MNDDPVRDCLADFRAGDDIAALMTRYSLDRTVVEGILRLALKVTRR